MERNLRHEEWAERSKAKRSKPILHDEDFSPYDILLS